MPDAEIFHEVAALLALAAAAGIVGLVLKQPLIVAFIATGILAGPDVLGVIQTSAHVDLLAEIGIAVLLFLVGLKLDLAVVRSLGAVALATGLGQVAFTAGVGYLICLALGLDALTSLYVAVALTFSSTIIIVKLLSDKREVDALHGRIAIGFLIVQDIVVVVAMIVLSTFGVGAGAKGGLGLGLVGTFAAGFALVGAVLVFVRYGAERLVRAISRTPELMVTFALAWAVMFAALCDLIGLGKELGGLLAGVSLASTSFREAIASRLSSLRDFLLLFFFVGLGAGLGIDTLGDQVLPALVLAAFVLVGNPLIVMIIMAALGYRKRTGFLAGLTVAQISEFSLIFMAMGVTLGHAPGEAIGLVTLVGLLTITLSTYMILYSHRLYAWCEPFVGWAERRDPFREREQALPASARYEVLIFGVGRYGREIAKVLAAHDVAMLGVDFDPEALERWRKRGHDGLFGDALDAEFPASLPLTGARWAVIATPPPAGPSVVHGDSRLVVMHALREAGFEGRIAVRSHDTNDARALMHAGADLVLQPFAEAAERAAEMIGYAPLREPPSSASSSPPASVLGSPASARSA
ncbi:cation:proton antiporter [Salinarimonas ramus]|uniref:Potassium efflux system protein n=1 Tax=Salinarimonas ramus TaxID=690164 RepID=A0A917V1Y0_9HYPH|nr:cation:proton antiporter family protein [Salinarimonas ramus]GGK19268.1 potassium efflux system protein [Salinarimonas ramus]